MARGPEAGFIELCQAQTPGFFGRSAPITVTRAPGRLDVMGGIADYSGSVVLEGTIGEAVLVGLQPRRDERLRMWSVGLEKEGHEPRHEVPLGALWISGREGYQGLREVLGAEAGARWIGYVAGVFSVLEAEGAAGRFRRGANILISSTVPMGAGVASSAALEVAVMYAVNVAYQLGLDGLELARLCQIVENRVVGAPCGIMDQVTCALGEPGKLIALKCQPHDVLGLHELPTGCRVAGINSAVKHSVGGKRYTRARTAAFMGLKIISEARGPEHARGHLCNLTPAQYRAELQGLLPGKMAGGQFLARYGRTEDPATTVDSTETYSVRACTEHPIYENARVLEFIRLLRQASEGAEGALVKAGRLMYASHWSYGKRCALGSAETDLLVRLVKDCGPKCGLYGAKITGGGCGGTVAILCRDEALPLVREIAKEYGRLTGNRPEIFAGTSPGAYAWGHETVAV